jgi:nicotinate-nucleotide--dimethylbenzimidazole phosphoribosyltransferase
MTSPDPNSRTDPERSVASLAASIRPVELSAAVEARRRDQQLTKPAGSLGRIEQIGFQLAAISGSAVPPLVEPAAVAVFAGDHGVHAEGVSPWPQAVTAQMVANFCAGGAAINVIGRANGLDVRVVNVGVAVPLSDHPLLVNRPVRLGTANLRFEPAMSRAEAAQAIIVGAEVATQLLADGAQCLLTGDMGIANTTPSAAVIAALLGADPARITGRGTGIDDPTLARKITVVTEALRRLETDNHDGPLGLLAQVGGLEIAALAGFCLAGAAARVPVIIDGVIAVAGALTACSLQPLTVAYLIAGHRSVEPAASAALEHLGLAPLLELDLRLGEGTGAALAYPLVRAAARLMREMATFDQAGVDSH